MTGTLQTVVQTSRHIVTKVICLEDNLSLMCLPVFWLQLENVKETETYKKAKEILEKFAPEKSQHLEVVDTF